MSQWRLAGVAVAALIWLLLYPLEFKLRALACSLAYSAMEWTFTLVERCVPVISGPWFSE